MVIAWIAALLIAEGTTNGPPLRTHVTAIETTLPFCLAAIQRFAHRLGHIERAMHDDIGDGVEPARRQILGARDEIAGGVVDEAGERAVAENLLDHRFDRGGVADVDAVARRRARHALS